MKKFSRYQLATIIAVFFHLTGLLGILFFNRDFFIRTSFLNLLLMFFLLLYTQNGINKPFVFFMLTCFIIGVGVEIIGTQTGWLFGNYTYNDVLGPEIQNVPIIIGINWFIIIYCCGVCIHAVLTRILEPLLMQTDKPKPVLKMASIIVDGASLAVLFDWIMEPVAIKLGYWTWTNFNKVPFFNYICWFFISSALMAVFHFAQFNKQNKFAVNLLLIQVMFFLFLRTFL